MMKVKIQYGNIPKRLSKSLGRQMGMRIGWFLFNNFHLNRVDGNTMTLNTTYTEWQMNILTWLFHRYESSWTVYGDEENV